MKTKSYYGLVIFSLVLFNLFFIFKIIVIKNFFEKEINFYKDEKRKQFEAFVRDMELNSQTIEIDKASITKVWNQIPKFSLIYAYTDDECNKCIIEDIAVIKQLIIKNKTKNVIILPVFEDSRNVNISLKADLDGLSYCRIDPGLIKFPIRDNGNSVRFFAVLTKDNKVILPFFPNVEDVERTRMYLEFVFTKVL